MTRFQIKIKNGSKVLLLMCLLGLTQLVKAQHEFNSYDGPYPQDIFETIRGCISPDGKQLVYGSFQTGDQSLRFLLYHIQSKKSIPLTVSKGFRRNPAWSPDGTKIIYTDIMEGRQGLWIIDVATKKEEQIFNSVNANATTPHWQNDNSIIFTLKSKDSTQLLQINSSGNNKKVIFSKLPVAAAFAALSPDGKTIAYSVLTNGYRNIHLVKSDGTSEKEVTKDLYLLQENPVWSNNGKYLYFTAATSNDSCFHAWQIEVSMSKLQRIENVEGDVMRISKTAAGKIAFTTFNPSLSVGTLPANGGEPKAVLPPQSPDALMPCWTNDGKGLYYMQGDWRQVQMVVTQNIGWDIHKSTYNIGDNKASANSLIIAEKGEDYGPCLSPNGKLLAFHSHRNNTDDTYIKNISSKNDTIITTSKGGNETGDPAWNSDGTKIIFTTTKDGDWNRPYIVEIDSSNGQPINSPQLVQLNNFQGHVYSSRFSPDNKMIAFCARLNDNTAGVFTVPTQGGEPTMLIKHSGGETYGFAEWGKDGQSIYYASNDGRFPYRIKRVSIDGKKTGIISTGAASAMHPRLSPDGKLLAVTMYNPGIKIWIEK